jgi:hypothetical protein
MHSSEQNYEASVSEDIPRRYLLWIGVAVDGVLVEQQINTNIISSANELPIINVQFTLRAEQVEDPITITLE